MSAAFFGFRRNLTGPQESLSKQLLSDVLMSLELARVHALADFEAVGAKLRAPFNQKIDHVIIEGEQGITALTF
jgi:hypothetical protein